MNWVCRRRSSSSKPHSCDSYSPASWSVRARRRSSSCRRLSASSPSCAGVPTAEAESVLWGDLGWQWQQPSNSQQTRPSATGEQAHHCQLGAGRLQLLRTLLLQELQAEGVEQAIAGQHHNRVLSAILAAKCAAPTAAAAHARRLFRRRRRLREGQLQLAVRPGHRLFALQQAGLAGWQLCCRQGGGEGPHVSCLEVQAPSETRIATLQAATHLHPA
jgi:hypothetical protein